MNDIDQILQIWLICIGQTVRSMSRYKSSMDEREKLSYFNAGRAFKMTVTLAS